MKIAIIVFCLMSLLCLPVYAGWFGESGKDLYLKRSSGIETHRAVFDYVADCELIAKTMNKAEPKVTWFCK